MEIMHLSPVAFLLLAIFWKMSRESNKADERQKKLDDAEYKKERLRREAIEYKDRGLAWRCHPGAKYLDEYGN
jgi:hypothetical protein